MKDDIVFKNTNMVIQNNINNNKYDI